MKIQLILQENFVRRRWHCFAPLGILGSAFVPALAANATAIFSSLLNATVGVFVAVALAKPLQNAMAQTNMGRALYHHA